MQAEYGGGHVNVRSWPIRDMSASDPKRTFERQKMRERLVIGSERLTSVDRRFSRRPEVSFLQQPVA